MLIYVAVNIKTVSLQLECTHGDVCATDQCHRHTHASNRCRLKSFTSCAFCGRLAAPDFVMKCTEGGAMQKSGSSIRISYISALSDWRSKMICTVYWHTAAIALLKRKLYSDSKTLFWSSNSIFWKQNGVLNGKLKIPIGNPHSQEIQEKTVDLNDRDFLVRNLFKVSYEPTVTFIHLHN